MDAANTQAITCRRSCLIDAEIAAAWAQLSDASEPLTNFTRSPTENTGRWFS
jgi:hypothetical protein